MKRLLDIAIECGAGVSPNPCNAEVLTTFTQHELTAFAAAIREECAALCEQEGAYSEQQEMAQRCADAIRGIR